MKTRLLAACAMSLCLALPAMAHATEIGVSMAKFDDNFLTVLRNGMEDYAKTMDGVTLQVEDAQNDVAKQLNQIQNFVAAGRRRDHRQPGRHRRHAGDDQARRRRRHSAGLCQPPADQRRHAARKRRLRRLERERFRHARDQGSLPAAQGAARATNPGDDGRAVQPGGACSAPRTSTT